MDRPRRTDAGLAALAAALVLPVTLGGDQAPGVLEHSTGVTDLGWLFFAAVHLPLVWRRRAPLTVFWVVAAIAVLSMLAGFTGVFLVSAPLFAVYAVARHRPTPHLWAPVAVFVLALGWAWVTSPPPTPVLIGILSVLTATALLGLSQRRHQDYRRQQLEHQARTAATAERTRIAREVHDIVAHNLAVMVALADGAAADPANAPDLLAKTSATGRAALADMRRLVGLLREGEQPLAPQPGLPDLPDLVDQVRAAGLPVELHQEGLPDKDNPGIGLVVYRITQEALTNTLHHAGAGVRAQVRLRHTDTEVELEITDTGAGQPGDGGHGLAGIAERAAAYGGTVSAGPAADGGWRVHARLPWEV
ncbi:MULTISPECIES: sensor histidine kinase [unclassified Crossiella]|uniref:sensor histidine kinase n=1 Tax=unclassified Crossiella TaxID=2620835 RepID=UPI001FFEE91D|nr:MULTISPECIES: histidine kinase [unclassified Crossiella]MCK2242673.1 histidine kinase [Crossiella sp. S99.2]MCK2256550.1 histidine kinase [Crossiella sp. S99.1]